MGDPNQYTDLDMGPLIDANALKSVEEKVKKAIEQGAEYRKSHQTHGRYQVNVQL